MSETIRILGSFKGEEGYFEFPLEQFDVLKAEGCTLEKWCDRIGVSRSTALLWQKEGSIKYFSKGARLFVLPEEKLEFWRKLRAGEFPAGSNAGKFWAKLRARGVIPQPT